MRARAKYLYDMALGFGTGNAPVSGEGAWGGTEFQGIQHIFSYIKFTNTHMKTSKYKKLNVHQNEILNSGMQNRPRRRC